jgi:hypothetical protein
MVYKTVISDVGLKFVIPTSGSLGEIKVANTVTNAWEELIFDFSSHIGLPEAIGIDQIVVFPDFNLGGRTQDNIIYFDNISFYSNSVGVDNRNETFPQGFALEQNFPNPFNPSTTIRYELPEDGLVNITIYDITGRHISKLVSSRQTAGYRSIQWDATNNAGKPMSAGLYLYTIQAGEFRQTKKMVLLK